MMKLKVVSMIAIAIALAGCNSSDENIENDKIYEEIAREAYIYALPAVEHNKAIHSILKDLKIPVNRFLANTELYTHENTVVVSPNNDTYYSHMVCDIRYEPVVINIPLIENRYFSFQLCDIFTNCPDYISTLATGDGPGNYMIARSDWEGNTPAGIDKVIRIPATVVFTLARTQVFGTQDTQAGEIAQSYTATPLSQFAGTTPPASEPLEWAQQAFDSKTGDIEGFFRMFNTMVQYQLLNDTDKALMKKFEAIGLGAGEDFSKSQFEPSVWSAIETGALKAKAEVEAQVNSAGEGINYWNFSPKNSGRWGTDYMTRATAAWKYIYVNTPEEAIYLTGNADSQGQPLNGANKYTITFAADEIPVVEFFWSLTIYNESGFLVDNPIKRYNIKDMDELVYGEDKSLTIYIQNEDPGLSSTANWLPAPDGSFYMILRLYGPSEEAINNEAVVPAVVKR